MGCLKNQSLKLELIKFTAKKQTLTELILKRSLLSFLISQSKLFTTFFKHERNTII